MKQCYQDARKYYVDKLGLTVNAPFEAVAKSVAEQSDGKVLFDVEGKDAAGQFLMLMRMKEQYFDR